MKISLLTLAFLVASICAEAADPSISTESVRLLNEQPVPHRQANAEAPGKFSVDHEAHAVACEMGAKG